MAKSIKSSKINAKNNEKSKKLSENNLRFEILHSMLPHELKTILETYCKTFKTSVFMTKSRDINLQFIKPKSNYQTQQLLIVQNSQNPGRSPKTMMALIYQIPIIGFQWVQNCLNSDQTTSKLIPYGPYEFKRPLKVMKPGSKGSKSS